MMRMPADLSFLIMAPGEFPGLDDLDALVDHNLRVGVVIWWDHGREEGDIYSKGVGGHLTASPDLLAEVFGGGLREGSEDSWIALS